jgi:hypothetical protein
VCVEIPLYISGKSLLEELPHWSRLWPINIHLGHHLELDPLSHHQAIAQRLLAGTRLLTVKDCSVLPRASVRRCDRIVHLAVCKGPDVLGRSRLLESELVARKRQYLQPAARQAVEERDHRLSNHIASTSLDVSHKRRHNAPNATWYSLVVLPQYVATFVIYSTLSLNFDIAMSLPSRSSA